MKGLKIAFSILLASVVAILAAISFSNSNNFIENDPENSQMKKKKAIQAVDEAEKHIYLMAVKYSGQQGAGVDAITSFQCWAGLTGLPIKIVEPGILNTNIRLSLSAESESSEFMALSEYFDIKTLNKVSREAGFAEIVPCKEFKKANIRRLMVLLTSRIVSTSKSVWSSNGTDSCYHGTDIPEEYKTVFQDYCIVSVTRVNISFLTELVTTQYRAGKLRDLSVVVWFWKGHFEPIPGCHHYGSKIQFQPSRRLLNDAHRYKERYIGDKDSYTAIMIRLEHIRMMEQGNSSKLQSSTKKCIQSVVDEVRDLPGSSNGMPMIAADIGKYGSISFDWAIKDKEQLVQDLDNTKSMMQELLKHRVSFEEWEESFVWAAGGVTHAGYIAALQRTIASQAKCLVLLGGGHFQDLALQDYVRVHSEKERCVRILCPFNLSVLKSRL